MDIFKKIDNHYYNKLPFTVYKKPNEKVVNGFFCVNDDLLFLKNFTETGFVFAPFDNIEKSIFFNIETCEVFRKTIKIEYKKKSTNDLKVDDNFKQNYISLIDKTINEIISGNFQKIVLSRVELVKFDSLKLSTLFEELLSNYRNAFTYIWYHPKVGLWLGASPETLLELDDSVFKTVSLAGTKTNTTMNNIVWGDKEIEEQQMVTDYIEKSTKHLCEKLNIEKAKTVKAGSLLHLKSNIVGTLKSNISLKQLTLALHPTPAVCGLPAKKAKNFILENENYNREFYSGFLGEINIPKSTKNKKSHLFVNLRCMSLENNIARIYVGGGITKDSIPEKEWEETVSKSFTMKSVLKKKAIN